MHRIILELSIFWQASEKPFLIVSSVFTFTLNQPDGIILNSAGGPSWASLCIARAMCQECVCVRSNIELSCVISVDVTN